jgi:hypothetical protein
MAKPQSLTSLAQSPEDERKSRMIKYTVAMTIRVICIVLAMLVQGWLMWVFFAGAIFLPYFAVVLANAAGPGLGNNALSKAVAPRLVIEAGAFTEPPAKKDSRTSSDEE